MKSVVLEDYTKPLIVKEIPIPKPGPNQVLVKLFASSINPSDLAMLTGSYANKNALPIYPGYEGAGLVIENGGGIMGWRLKGKRVSISGNESSNGTWSEYIVVDTANCLEIDGSMTYEEGCSCFVNPLTVVAMLDLCKIENYKAIVNSAAASALGKMILRAFKLNGIKVINVVRRKDQVENLLKEGAEFVLNQNEEDFETKLKEISQKLNALCFFDAVSGDLTSKILKNMPNGSTAYIYGSLENDKLVILPGDIIFKRKTIKGFWVSLWVKNKGLIGKTMLIYNLKTMLKNTLKTEVQKRFPLELINEAIEHYKKNMSLGKVIITPINEKSNEMEKEEIKQLNKIPNK